MLMRSIQSDPGLHGRKRRTVRMSMWTTDQNFSSDRPSNGLSLSVEAWPTVDIKTLDSKVDGLKRGFDRLFLK